ncbi:DEAD box protein [Guillardia theta]|uniref:DEAD box protein n=1 Tax=Guillardia theta TaxID=55529 RepID=Q9AW05_GUITH|nr:DEAD box protein [Guillardia theta]CAC27066.1 DEAD box protein [Guillardia theta]|mmetsp:Transcript_18747/g.61577  ORF Transcript_18747/g.61577 Transcript_18747/m.61577 type:complete len:387 (-) Transcript_18747:7158-8318(-)
MVKFDQIGICKQISRVCEAVGFKKATKVQVYTIPHFLIGKDLLVYSQTGSGKTLAYILPLLQKLLYKKNNYLPIIIVPSRELVFQISTTFETISCVFNIRIASLTGGIDPNVQLVMISSNPDIIISTPGRLVEILKLTKNLEIKFCTDLVLDEADKLIHSDFKREINIINSKTNKNKKLMLFSATMSLGLEKIKFFKISNPVRIIINQNFFISPNLIQNYIFCPFRYKEIYLLYLINEFYEEKLICFVETQKMTEKISILLKKFSFDCYIIHGSLSQNERIDTLSKFTNGKKKILVATDLASRGLDICAVSLIINYDFPIYLKDYIHRTGRTGRAGRAGRAISLITQYDLRTFQKIESILNIKIAELNISKRKIEYIKNVLGKKDY